MEFNINVSFSQVSVPLRGEVVSYVRIYYTAQRFARVDKFPPP
ncbi:hypothetical protein HMPREF9628_02026, partial [Peptoanaerobacter stomatis]